MAPDQADQKRPFSLSRRQLLVAGVGIASSPRLLAAGWLAVPPTIQPVSTSTAAFIGTCAAGPLNHPVLLTSFLAFTTQFGQVSSKPGTLPYAVYEFFNNGGQACHVVRVKNTKPATLLGASAPGTGIFALNGVHDFRLLALPGVVNAEVWKAAATFCASRRAFLILDGPGPNVKPSEMASVLHPLNSARSSSAAVYYPWIVTSSLVSAGKPVTVPPSGAVAGVFCTSDAGKGVWKAPAGLSFSLVGVDKFAFPISEQEMGSLNALGVNCLRSMPSSGPIIFGARTFQAQTNGYDYQYVNVRRFVSFVEESIVEGLAWTTFESNNEALWAKVRLSVNAFLMGLFRQGAFQGSTAAQAFMVRCDTTTMTQAEINQGVVNIVIGLAMLRPAEFVVVKIAVSASSS